MSITFPDSDLTIYADDYRPPRPRNRLAITNERRDALRDVFNNRVRFHNGLTGASIGYTTTTDTPLPQQRQDTLRELWAADFIDIDSYRLFAENGHGVHVTHAGYTVFLEWAQRFTAEDLDNIPEDMS